MSSEAATASIEFRVRYAETDQMGVVYHANYLVWCELGRTELIRARGTPYAELERQGVVLAVADASVRYHAAARYDDRICVEAWVADLRSRTVTFGYRVLRLSDDGAAPLKLATASTTLISLDRASKPMKLPADLINRLSNA
jgi:acyl-CoA thioester hydrolase